MNRRLICIALFLVGFCSPMALLAQEGGMPPMGPPEELKKLDYTVGTWVAENFQSRMDPSAPWGTSKITMKFEPIYDGCALRAHVWGTMMGMDFKGQATTTYSRETGKYRQVWFDNMSASQEMAQGGFEGDKLVFNGSTQMMGQKYLFRDITTKVSATEMEWAYLMSSDDGTTWWNVMKATYKKQ